MQNFTFDNFMIVSQAMLQIAINFWPVIAFIFAIAVCKPFFSRARPKSKTAKTRRLNSQYSRDCAQQSGRRHL